MRDRSVAYHEAGHAVAAYRFNLLLGKITIEPAEGKEGSSESEGGWSDGPTAREQIVVLYAGRAAEALFFPDAEQHGYEQDEESAAYLLRFQPDAEQELRAEAANIVSANREAIRALADLLLIEKTIGGDDLDVAIGCIDDGLDVAAELQKYRALKNHAMGTNEGTP